MGAVRKGRPFYMQKWMTIDPQLQLLKQAVDRTFLTLLNHEKATVEGFKLP